MPFSSCCATSSATHTKEHTNKPEGQFFHTEWPEMIG